MKLQGVDTVKEIVKWLISRGTPKEHFYQIILESDKQFQRRRFLKFGHFVPFLIP